jgi:hypothetical protein
MTDGYFYHLLLKLENSNVDLFTALDQEIAKHNDKAIAEIHYDKCLKAKSFFSLVSHMVN